jgi:hypothetical protein
MFLLWKTTMAMAIPDYSAATFGDPQLSERLRIITVDLETHPGCPMPQACRSAAALKGAYRFFDHPNTAVANILPAFVEPSVEALAHHEEVIVPQDTTTFNFTHLSSASGLGYINDSEKAKGIHLHSTLLLDGDGDLVGIADLQFWVRPTFRQETAEEVRQLPIEEKESYKWMLGIHAAHAAFAAATDNPPRLIHVMDREGDIHEVFAEVRKLGDHAVIRCAQDRRVEGEQPDQLDYAKNRVAEQKALGTMELRVPCKDGGYRTAVVEVRAADVRLRPDESKHKRRKPVALGLVEVREISQPPEGEKAAQWWLWTTLPMRKLKHVQRVLRIYKARWRLEDYHRAMKTGCKVENMRLQDGEKLMKALAIQAWVATRVVRLRDEAKNDPEQDCETCFLAEEWKLLWARQHGRPWREGDGKPKLGEVVKWLGRLGGHLGRKNDPMPGAECLSKAIYALDLLLQGRDLGRAESTAERDKLKEQKTES